MKSISLVTAVIALQAMYVLFVNIRNKNNVCTTFEDYYTDRDTNKNCYYNPDYRLEVPDIIQRHEYPLETHYVTTADGHILTLFRIPHGKNENTTKIGKPVLLQHGFISNSAGFVNVGQKSLGFILANHGYDVWLGNFRGTKYSKNHTYLTTSDNKYWDFSFHENGIYDLPALINYISEVTNQKITYIGFSLGTTAMYVYSATYPKVAEKQVRLIVSLGPAAFPAGMTSLLRHTLPYWQLIKVLRFFFDKIDFPETFVRYACTPYPFQLKLCYLPFNFIAGFNDGQHDPETLLSSVNHLVDALHLKTFHHIIQQLTTNKFKQFNYGTDTNLKLYGTREPPIYNLSKIKIPNYLVRAENDMLITQNGVEKLHRILPNLINKHDIYVIKDAHFSHMDFLNGKDVVPLLYNHILNIIK